MQIINVHVRLHSPTEPFTSVPTVASLLKFACISLLETVWNKNGSVTRKCSIVCSSASARHITQHVVQWYMHNLLIAKRVMFCRVKRGHQ